MGDLGLDNSQGRKRKLKTRPPEPIDKMIFFLTGEACTVECDSSSALAGEGCSCGQPAQSATSEVGPKSPKFSSAVRGFDVMDVLKP